MTKALGRFWWVLALGLLVAALAAVALVTSAAKSYTAVAQILITSPEAPYYRINVETGVTTPRTPGARAGAISAPTVSLSAPDVNTLVRAANLYPFLIASDLVAAERERQFGDLPGEVSARALFAIATANRFEASDIPIIQVIGQADTPAQSSTIAQATVDAFTTWMNDAQDEGAVKPRDRVLIQQIRKPTEVVGSGGAPESLVVLVVCAIMAAFGLLAVVLDRTFPPRETAPGDAAVAEA